MGRILPEKMYKTRITDLDELKQRLRTEWAMLDPIVLAATIRQSLGGGQFERRL